MAHSQNREGSQKKSKQYRVILPLLLTGTAAIWGIIIRGLTSFGNDLTITPALLEYTHRFSHGFERIFLEAVPFMLVGALAAAAVEVLLSEEEVQAIYSEKLIPGMAAGLLTGLILPLGEGGSILLARTLLKKGAALPSTIVMMLAAPALNLPALAILQDSSDLNAVFWFRVAFGVVFAILFALFLSTESQPERLLRSDILNNDQAEGDQSNFHSETNQGSRLKSMGVTAAKRFLEFTPYLIAAALIGAILQTFIPNGWIPPGQGSISGQIGAAGLWSVVSAHSNIGDILAIQNSAISWPLLSQTVFLTLGILVDIKLAALYLLVLKKKAVLYLIILAFAAVGAAAMIFSITGQMSL